MKTNEDLQQEVVAEIKWDPQLKDVHTQISVVASDGIITLGGIVDTYAKRMAAERAAQRVKGVKIVACDIEVDTIRKKTDRELAEVVDSVLHWNSTVNSDNIKILIDDAWIYLDGTVEWEYERIFAQRCLENLVGVRGITNNISIQPNPVDPEEIRNSIVKTFERSATVDSAGVSVFVTDNKVTLTGKVRSWAERKDAERAARLAPGVSEVDNQLEVDSKVYAF